MLAHVPAIYFYSAPGGCIEEQQYSGMVLTKIG